MSYNRLCKDIHSKLAHITALYYFSKLNPLFVAITKFISQHPNLDDIPAPTLLRYKEIPNSVCQLQLHDIIVKYIY